MEPPAILLPFLNLIADTPVMTNFHAHVFF
jgi:hypothetical protein